MHPVLGAGLFCLLNLPHVINDDDTLDRMIMELYQLELLGQDLPPHFCARCRGKRGNNLAYVSFLPNELHVVNGIAVNMSIRAAHRAGLADALLQLEVYQ